MKYVNSCVKYLNWQYDLSLLFNWQLINRTVFINCLLNIICSTYLIDYVIIIYNYELYEFLEIN